MDNLKNWYAFLLSILTVATCEEALMLVDPDVEISSTKKAFERIKNPEIIQRRMNYKERKGSYVPLGSKCSVPECTNTAKPYRMRCERHIQVRVPTALKENCSIDGCKNIEYAKKMCYAHYQKSRQTPCITPGCKNISNRRGFCSKCYLRKQKEGLVNVNKIDI